jgi:hypothetical protein
MESNTAKTDEEHFRLTKKFELEIEDLFEYGEKLSRDKKELQASNDIISK